MSKDRKLDIYDNFTFGTGAGSGDVKAVNIVTFDAPIALDIETVLGSGELLDRISRRAESRPTNVMLNPGYFYLGDRECYVYNEKITQIDFAEAIPANGPGEDDPPYPPGTIYIRLKEVPEGGFNFTRILTDEKAHDHHTQETGSSPINVSIFSKDEILPLNPVWSEPISSRSGVDNVRGYTTYKQYEPGNDRPLIRDYDVDWISYFSPLSRYTVLPSYWREDEPMLLQDSYYYDYRYNTIIISDDIDTTNTVFTIEFEGRNEPFSVDEVDLDPLESWPESAILCLTPEAADGSFREEPQSIQIRADKNKGRGEAININARVFSSLGNTIENEPVRMSVIRSDSYTYQDKEVYTDTYFSGEPYHICSYHKIDLGTDTILESISGVVVDKYDNIDYHLYENQQIITDGHNVNGNIYVSSMGFMTDPGTAYIYENGNIPENASMSIEGKTDRNGLHTADFLIPNTILPGTDVEIYAECINYPEVNSSCIISIYPDSTSPVYAVGISGCPEYNIKYSESPLISYTGEINEPVVKQIKVAAPVESVSPSSMVSITLREYLEAIYDNREIPYKKPVDIDRNYVELMNHDNSYIYGIYDAPTRTGFDIIYKDTDSTAGEPPLLETHPLYKEVTVQDLGTLEKTGYSFINWRMVKDYYDGFIEPGSKFRMPDMDIVMHPNWTINQYTLTYHSNQATEGTTPDPVTKDFQSEVTVDDTGNLKRTGYSVTGWNTDPDGLEDSYSPGDTFTIPSYDATLFVEWAINYYELSYRAERATSGKIPGDQLHPFNSQVPVAPQDNLRRRGWNFGGWNTEENYTGDLYTEGQKIQIPAYDIILYAQWDSYEYTVYFDSHYATDPAEPEEMTVATPNETISSYPSQPRKTGYSFQGWFTEPEMEGDEFTTSTVVSGDIEVSAAWYANNYTIIFDPAGGIEPTINEKVVTFDDIYGTLAETDRSGYTFTRWKDPNSNIVEEDTVVYIPEDHTITAEWIPNQYTVTFDENGGSSAVPSSKTVTFDDQYGPLAESYKKGHTLENWYVSGEVESLVYPSNKVKIPKDHDLYAKWILNNYRVNFTGPIGSTIISGPSSKDIYYMDEYGMLPQIEYTGHTFIEWNEDPYGSGQVIYSNSIMDKDYEHNIYSLWSINSYRIEFDKNYYANIWDPTENDYMLKEYEHTNISGELPDSIYLEFGKDILIPSGEVYSSGFIFEGWNTLAEGNGNYYQPGDIFTIPAEDTILYMQWNEDRTNIIDEAYHKEIISVNALIQIPDDVYTSGSIEVEIGEFHNEGDIIKYEF